MTSARSRALYRALLGMLPRELREEFGRDMEQLFANRLAELEGRPVARASLWIAALGDVVGQAAREHASRAWRAGWTWDAWAQDIRFGTRTLLRRPGFAVAAIATLALGMGASVAMFSVVNGVLLRPLPFPDPDRVVRVLATDRVTGEQGTSHDHPDIRMWQDRVPGFRAVGYSGADGTLTGFGDPEVIEGTGVTDGMITLMGFPPFLGRDLTREDDVPDGPRVLVVSYAFWSDRLGRDPDAIGRTLTLNDNPWEIVGVAPEGFDFPAGSTMWLPLRHPADDCGHGCEIFSAVGRVDASTTLETVQSRLDALSAELAADIPEEHRDDGVRVVPLLEYQVANVRTALWVLLGAVLLVLLISCGNVANLLLVRASARMEEVSLRSMLGAGRGRIVRQLLTESMVIAVAAGALGLALATWGTALLVRMAPASIPRLQGAGLDGRVVLFATALVILVPALFGTLPALHSTSSQATHAGTGSRVAGKRGAGRSRSLLLAGEVAFSLTLVLGAGLLIQTLRILRAVDYGFATSRVERFYVSTPDSRYDADAVIRFQETLEERLLALPEVAAVGMGFDPPLAPGAMGATTTLLDRPEVPQPDRPVFWMRPVTPGYLDANGLTLLRGRWIEAGDRLETESVGVVSETAARTLYAGVDPIGKQLKLNLSWAFSEDPVRTIVGVVADAHYEGGMEPPDVAIYLPNAQFAANAYYVTLRLADGAESAIPGALAALHELDPLLAATRVSRIEDEVASDQASSRFYMTVLTVFSILSLVLAAVGLYGVVAYAVSQRTREIGIRVALGAGGGTVTVMAARQGLGPALLGIVAGLLLARLLARVLDSLLFGVEPGDPMASAAATAVLIAVAVAATLLPAMRASRIAPASALRSD